MTYPVADCRLSFLQVTLRTFQPDPHFPAFGLHFDQLPVTQDTLPAFSGLAGLFLFVDFVGC